MKPVRPTSSGLQKASQAPAPFNPLDEYVLARTVREELERQTPHPLLPPEFKGTGLYALYYVGTLPVYKDISDMHIPIYVGKAEAGRSSTGVRVQGIKTKKLWQRIEKHAKSIDAAKNLNRKDFRVRYLVMHDVHILLGEDGLLQEYAPVWNVVLTGLGNNPLGAGRKKQKMSRWDVLHPGRNRSNVPQKLSVKELTKMIELAILAKLRGNEVPQDALPSDELHDGDDADGADT